MFGALASAVCMLAGTRAGLGWEWLTAPSRPGGNGPGLLSLSCCPWGGAGLAVGGRNVGFPGEGAWGPQPLHVLGGAQALPMGQHVADRAPL